MSRQAMLAIAAVAGFAFGRPIARNLVATVPGVPAGQLGENTIGAIAGVVAFQVAKRAF